MNELPTTRIITEFAKDYLVVIARTTGRRGEAKTRRKTMKIMLRTALTALSIASISPAFAEGGDGTIPNTYFTQLPGVVAQAPVQNPSVATAQNGQGVHAYVTNSNHGIWLFAPQDGGGANN